MSEAIEFTDHDGDKLEIRYYEDQDMIMVSTHGRGPVSTWTYIELPREDVDKLMDFLNSQVDSYG